MRRTTAVLTIALAATVTADALTSAAAPQRWGVVLVAAAVLGAVVAAVRVWTLDCFCGRVTAGVLGALVLVGQTLSAEVGLPGRAPVPWAAAGVVTALVSVALVAVASFGVAVAGRGEAVEHPYAL
jgi:hypothetical protein